jgi:hypothetical protein
MAFPWSLQESCEDLNKNSDSRALSLAWVWCEAQECTEFNKLPGDIYAVDHGVRFQNLGFWGFLSFSLFDSFFHKTTGIAPCLCASGGVIESQAGTDPRPKGVKSSQAQWCMPEVPTLGRPRQENWKFKASLATKRDSVSKKQNQGHQPSSSADITEQIMRNHSTAGREVT